MEVSEMRWPASSYCDIEHYRLYYSGKINGSYKFKMGMVVNRDNARHVTNFVPVNERNMIECLTSKDQHNPCRSLFSD